MFLSRITFIVLRIERQAKVPGCKLRIIDGVPVLLVCESVSFTCLLAVYTVPDSTDFLFVAERRLARRTAIQEARRILVYSTQKVTYQFCCLSNF